MISLTDKQKLDIIKQRLSRIVIDDKAYYLKENENGNFLELVVKRLADKVGIRCAEYEPISIYEEQYYISEDLNNKYHYVPASVITKDTDSLYDTWLSLENLSHDERKIEGLQNHHVFINSLNKEDIEMIMKKLVRIYLFDMFILNCDRHDDNWALLFKKDNEIPSTFEDVIILDNETSFNTYAAALKHSYFDEELDHFGFNHEILDINIKNMDYFIKTSSPEDVEMLKEMVEILTPGEVINTFNEIEKEYNVTIEGRERFTDLYLENYNLIDELVSSRGLIC